MSIHAGIRVLQSRAAPGHGTIESRGLAPAGEVAPIDALVARVRELTGIVPAHLVKLQSFARTHDCLIAIRPVDPLATDLIESGHPTKGFHIKGKSSNWGPQAAFICVDQRLSKLENQSGRIEKYNLEVSECIRDGYARSVPLELGRARLDKLLSEGVVARVGADRHREFERFEARAPSGKSYVFEALRKPLAAGGEERFEIRLDGKPVAVLAPPREEARPLTADYDLFVVAPRIGSYGAQDRVPVPDISHDAFRARLDRYRSGVPEAFRRDYAKAASFHAPEDQDLGNVSRRVREMIPAINRALVGDGEPVVHHGADMASPAADPSANYPLTFALPEKIGRFDEICIVNDAHELAELVGRVKHAGYHVPLNPLWEEEVTRVRRPAFVEARERMAAYFGS